MMQKQHQFSTVGILLLIIVIVKSRRILKGTCGSNAAFYRVATDYILDEEPISRNVTDDINECLDVCVEVPTCVAFNTHKRQGSKVDCHLLKNDHISKSNKLKSLKGWSFYFTGTREISRTVSIQLSIDITFIKRLPYC